MAMVRALLPIVGLVVIFLLFNVLTDFRMMGNMSLAFPQVYVTMIAAMGVFFIMTMGGLDFSQGSILGIASNRCMYSFKTWNCNCNSWWYYIRCDHRLRSTDSSMYTVRSNHSLLQFVPCSYSVDLSNI